MLFFEGDVNWFVWHKKISEAAGLFFFLVKKNINKKKSYLSLIANNFKLVMLAAVSERVSMR